MFLRIGQSERGTPAAAEDQPFVDAHERAQPLHVVDKMPGRVGLKAGMRRGTACSALVEQHHVVAFGMKGAAVARRNAAAGATMEEDGRFRAGRAAAFIIEDMPVADIERAGLIGFDFGI